MRPIRKGDGTGLSVPGVSEVRKGDGTVLWSAGGAIRDSVVARGVAKDHDGSQWVSEIGPNIPDVQGGPTKLTDVIAGEPVVSYNGSTDVSQTTTSIASTDPQAIIFTAKSDEPSSTGPHYIDSAVADGFAVQQNSGGYRPIRGGSVTSPGGSTDSNFHVFCLEGFNDDEIRFFVDDTSSPVVSASATSGNLDGLTFGARADQKDYTDMQIAEYSVLEGHSVNERDNEVTRQLNKYNL